MRVLILASGFKLEYHVMRLVVAAGHSAHILGMGAARQFKYSRYCSSFHEFNFDPLSRPLEETLAELKTWINRLSVDLVIPSDIVSTRLLVELGPRLPMPTNALPTLECFDRVNDKWQFFQLCRDNGIRVPQSWFFEDAAKLKAALGKGDLQFPLIIKPLDSMNRSGVNPLMNVADARILDTIHYKPVLVQKFITGQYVGIDIVANKGRVGAYAIQRNLSDRYQFVHNAELLSHATRFAEASGYHGAANLDAMEEKGTGHIYMLECNPRFWYSIFALGTAGMNCVEFTIDPSSLDPEHPVSIPDIEILHSKAVLIKLATTFSLNKTDWKVLQYAFGDPAAKLCSVLTRHGSLFDQQVAALAAMRAGGKS